MKFTDLIKNFLGDITIESAYQTEAGIFVETKDKRIFRIALEERDQLPENIKKKL